MFDCPVCSERHSVPNNYDNKEYVCANGPSRRSRRTFQNIVPEDQLSRNEPLMNRSSTLIDEARAATVNIAEPDYRDNGERIGNRVKRNY